MIIRHQILENETLSQQGIDRNKILLLTLFSIDIYYLVTTSGICFNFVYYKFQQLHFDSHSYYVYLALISYTKNAFTFVFYFTISHKFRRVLFDLVTMRSSPNHSDNFTYPVQTTQHDRTTVWVPYQVNNPNNTDRLLVNRDHLSEIMQLNELQVLEIETNRRTCNRLIVSDY
jgi:hypothetical protein